MPNDIDPISQARIHVERSVLERAATDAAFRDLLKRDPHGALKEMFEIDPVPGYRITVVEEQPSEITIVLPRQIEQDDLPDELLDIVSGGDGWTYRFCPTPAEKALQDYVRNRPKSPW